MLLRGVRTSHEAYKHFGMGIRLAGVQFSLGSEVLGPNLNLHPEVQFRQVVNTNLNLMFKFRMFGSGSVA